MSTIHREPEARAARFHVPTLRQIFWGPLANGFRRMAQWRRQGVLGEALQEYRRRSIRFEALEPRLLLSADLTYTAEVGAAIDATLRVEEVEGAAILRLVDNQSSTVLDERLLDQDVDVSVNGGDLNDRLVIDFDQATLAYQVQVGFIGGAGNDTFIFAGGSLAGAIEGGAGEDTLVGPAASQTWTIDGANSGNVAGVQFSGMENLEGAADNEDAFVFGAGGSVSGVVEGGAGGFDSVALDGGVFDTVTFAATNADSGTISRDGNVLSYSGMEPLVAPTITAANVEIFFDDVVQTISIEDDGNPANGLFQVTSTGSEDVLMIPVPTASLIVHGGAAVDTITIEQLDNDFAVNNPTVTIDAGGGNDIIDVNATTGTGTYTINGGQGDDTYKLDDNWGDVTLVEGAAAGDGADDTIDFTDFGGGAITITPGVALTIADAATGTNTVTVANANVANFEALEGANIDLTGSLTSVASKLRAGMQGVVDFVRNLAAFGDLATELPLIGKNAEVTIGKFLDFAEALDQLRFEVDRFLDEATDAGSLTTDDLKNYIDTAFFGGASPLAHLGAAVLTPGSVVDGNGLPIDPDNEIAAADFYDFKLTVDGVDYRVKVDMDIAPGTDADGDANEAEVGAGSVLTVTNLRDQINFGLNSIDALAGQVIATTRDGRIAFQVVSTEIESFAVAAGDMGAALTKLKLPAVATAATTIASVQDALGGLGSLALEIAAQVVPVVTFESGLPNVRFNIDYQASREGEFFYDLGEEAEQEGLAFDVEAQLDALAELVFAFDVRLALQDATTVDFLLDVDELRGGVTLNAAVSNVELNFGFVGLEADGSLTLDAGVKVDPLTSLQDVTDPASIDVSLLGLDATDAAGTGDPAFDVDLTLDVDTGISNLGGGSFATASATVTANGDPFDPLGVDLDIVFDADANFPDFNNLSAAGVISAIGQVAGWLDNLRSGELLSSIDIPLLDGGLDAILDLAEVVSDALLYDDGADNDADGAEKLVTDLNAALGAAKLGGLLRFVGDGTEISLRAIDASVESFSVQKDAETLLGDEVDLGGFAQLGFNAMAVTPSSGTPEAITGIDPTGAAGVITLDAGFIVTVTRNSVSEDFQVFLDADDTSDNVGVGDDTAKLLDADNAPTFSNAQELAGRLLEILPLPGGVHYDPVHSILTYDIEFRDVDLFEVELPLDFELDLAPLGAITSDTRLIIGASGGLALTLGFDLSETPPSSSLLDLTDTLEDLGVDVKLEEAGSADGTPRTIVGQLSGDASFEVSFGNDTVTDTTSGAGTSTSLVDAGQNFLADGKVKPGDTVFNLTDGSKAKVVSVANGSLTTTPLTGGSDNTWGAGDAYRTAHLVTVKAMDGSPATDINVTQRLDGQAETAIAVNPTDPDNMIVGANDLNATDGIFGSSGSNDSVWVTTDGGQNWTRMIIPLPAGGLAAHGDPTIVFDRTGRAVYAHLVHMTPESLGADGAHGGSGGNADGDHVLAVAVSTDKGASWTAHVVTAVDADAFTDDKEYLAVGPDVDDPDQDRFVVLWHERSVIYSSTSTDGGVTWSAPVIVSNATGGSSTDLPRSDTAIDSVPAFGPNGEIYAVWENFGETGVSKIMFDVSLDGGATWGLGGQEASVSFGTNDFALGDDDKAVLDAFAALLNADSSIVVTIEGHTDTQGLSAANQTLSDNRALAVFNYLTGVDVTSPHSIAASRLTQVGFGEALLAVDTGDALNDGVAGTANQANRRVDLKIDRLVYTGNVNAFRDQFNGGLGLDATDEGAADGMGDYEIPAQPARGVWMGVSIDVDRSGGDNDGRIYVSFADQGDLDDLPDAGSATDHHNLDVFVIASDDLGASWDALGASLTDDLGIAPERINFDDTGTNSQFFAWLDVDQASGNVAVSWYDARNDTNLGGPDDTDTTGAANDEVQYFASFSTDGGNTWTVNRLVSDGVSDGGASGGNNFLDYTGLAFFNDTIHMVWADNSDSTGDNPDGPGGALDVYYDRIPLRNLTIDDLIEDINFAIAQLDALDGKIVAQAVGNKVKLAVIDTALTSLKITTTNTDPAFRDLGIQQAIDLSEADDEVLEFTSSRNAPTFVGQLTHDATFDINFFSGSTTAVTVEQGATVSSYAPNRNILDLVFDVQDAIDEALVHGTATAGSSGTSLVHEGMDFGALEAAGEINVGDIILNVTTGAVGTIAGISGNTLTTSALTGGAGGDNAWGPSDLYRINPIEVGSETGRLLFTRVGPTATGDADSFTITETAIDSAAELGITSMLESDEADLLIVESDGVTRHRIALDQVSTIGELITAINAQSVGAIVASLTVDNPNGPEDITPVNEANTGLTITEASNPGVFSTTTSAGTSTTLNDSSQNFLTNGLAKVGDTIYNLSDGSKATILTLANGSLTTTPLAGGTANTWGNAHDYSLGKFKVGLTNGSLAAIQLGLIGTDTNPQDDADVPDGKVVGATIAGATLLDRFFISTPGADTNANVSNDPDLLNDVISAQLEVRAGALLSKIKIDAVGGGDTTITAEGFDFTKLDDNDDGNPDSPIQVQIKDVAGFAPGLYNVTEIVDDDTIKLGSTAIGVVGQQGGAGVLDTGLQASAVFGFIEIGLNGTADLGAKLSWGFNTADGAPGADGRLTAQEVIDALSEPLSLMLLPDLAPIPVAGTTTSAGTATTLTDSSGQFQSRKRVAVGDVVRNTTQNKTATIVSIDSDTQLTMSALSGGGTWANADDYEIEVRNFGVVDAEVSLDLAGGLSGLATAVGVENPELALRVLALGDPFIGTRFDQANYAATNDTTFTLDGNFTSKLPVGATLRFGDEDFTIATANFASGTTTVTVTPVEDGDTLPGSLDDVDVVLLPKVEVDMSDLGDILPDFQNFGLADIIALLQALAGYLSQFESFGFLNEPLPLIDTSVNDLLGFADDFAQALQEFESNPAGSLQLLEDKLLESLGLNDDTLDDIVDFVNDGPSLPGLSLPSQPVNLEFDVPSGMLKFDIVWGTSFSEGLDIGLPGLEFGDALEAFGLGSVLDLAGSANLEAEGTVLARLTLGVSVADFDVDLLADGFNLATLIEELGDHLFLFDTTGLEARLRVAGEDISFRVGVGPFSLSIGSTDPAGPNPQVASIELDGSVGLGFKDEVFDPDLDGLDPGDDSVSFSDFFGQLSFDNIDASLEGTIEGYLPVFFPNDTRFIGAIKIGGTDADANFTPTGDLVNLVETFIDTGELNFELISEDADAGTMGVQGALENAIAIDVTDVIEGITSFDLTKLSIFDNILLAVDGLDMVLEMVEDVFDNTSITLPLIGDDLNKAAGFIGDMRDDFIDPLRNLVETAKDAAADFADANKNVISKAIFDVLGPNGANILRPQEDTTGFDAGDPGYYIGLNTNLDDFLFPEDGETPPARDEVFIEWDLNLGSTLVDEPFDIGFDLGIPGLGLETEGDLNILIDWALDLSFGLDFVDGFYLKTDDADELLFNAAVTLPNAGITGTLGFLALTGVDKPLDFGPDFGTKQTALGATFKVDISNVTAEGNVTGATSNTISFVETYEVNELQGKLVKIVGGAGDDQTFRIASNTAHQLTIDGNWGSGRTPADVGDDHDVYQILDPNMGFTEFGNIDFDARIAAEASAALGLTLGLSEDLVGADVAAGFPSVNADFRFLWQLGNRATDMGTSAQQIADNPDTRFRSFESLGEEGFGAIENGLKLVSIEDITLDLGSFIGDVLGPIVDEVSKFTKPVQPIIDFITSPVPIIGQLGLDITWLDLAEMLAGDKVNVALIRSITEIISFVNQIAELSESDSIMLPIGDFIIFDATGDGGGFQPSLWDGGFDLNSAVDLDNPGSLSGIIGNIFGTGSELGGIVEGAISGVLDGLSGGEGDSADVLHGLTSGQSAGGFSFPFLEDPSQIFGLLMGNNIDLVAYDLGALNFGFEFSQFFSIFGPLGVSIGLDVQIDIDTAFVYDTQGIRDFVESDFRNPLLLLNGFAIAADPRLDGVDDPELRFFAELQAAAELNLGIARAGVAAAFGFEILFNLFDPDGDGRIRITEIIGNIENQLRAPDDADKLLAPLAIFDISGEIFARLFAFLEIDFGFFQFEKEFPIFGPETLLSFDVDFFRPPILASELDNGDLLIHTGEFADQRLLGDATDLSEHIRINKVGESSGTITLTIESTGSSTGGDSLGDDSEVPLEYHMKKGSKLIFDGGKGNDRLEVTGFDVGDVLFEIDMGVGDDEVLLSGGIADEFSTIIGGKGKDDITGSDGADLITGGQGDDTINAGDGEDLVFGDDGEIGTDLATGTARPTDGVDTIDGEGGSDILFGGGGRDQLHGGTGGSSDLLIGGEGTVLFQAGTFKKFANVVDLLQEGVDGVENLALDKSAGDVLTGDAGDMIFGTAGPDVITGTSENDIIFGMGGADTIDGLGGNDIIFGDGGALNPGAGGSGTATGGNATTLTDAGANFSSVKIGDYVWNLSEDKFVRVTAVNSATEVVTEAVTGWSGDSYKFFVPTPVAGTADAADTIEGGTGDDLIFGGGGNDFLAGDAIETGALPGTGGNDQVYGGGGADKIFGDNVQVDGSGKTAIVPLVSGDGDDRLFGQGENDAMYGGGGFDYMDGGAGSDRLFGGNGSDTLIFNKGSDRLDGEDGGDGYFAIMQGGNNESLVIAQDTGATGSDLLLVQGTVLADQFLLRANTAGSDAFIAMIKQGSFVERINYGGTLERILINGSFGDDHFAVDDTAAEITINGEFGDDTFQVGQIFRSQRTPAEANISVNPFDDTFATIETTRGFLSNGISEPMTINGGLGNDLFTVFHNKAVLQLNGEGGDDTFEIRAFALVGSQEPQRERTDLSGGEGADLVMYVVNAPVNIDGGDGFDTVVVIGTEFGDDFVVTEDGVFGAGLTVSFVNIESLRVDAAEGNDRVFIQSTSEKFITEVFGGLGEDTVFMSGPTPPIVSNDLRGHSGIVLHGVESSDANFDGQNLFGISANVADNDEPFIALRPTAGSTIITEGGMPDEFDVVLTRAPTRPIDVFIFAPLPTPSARERGQQMFRVTTGVPPADEPTVGGSSITLQFTAANWYIPQTVQVIADSTVFEDRSPSFLPIATRPEIVELGETGEPPREFVYDDEAYEGVRFGVVNISVKAAITEDHGDVVDLNDDLDVLTVLAADLVDFDATTIIGQNLQIKTGPAMGQNRFVTGYQLDGLNVHLTLDRPYAETEFPDNTSAWVIQDDDSLVGLASSIDEDTAGLIDDNVIPEITDPNDDRSIFVDEDGFFMTGSQGEGLVGAVLEIVAGAGLGQQQLILGHGIDDPTTLLVDEAETTLILAGQWRTNPDETSVYRIERYDGLALPSVLVQVNDNDLPGLVVDETQGFEDDGDGDDEAIDVVDDYDTITAVIEGGDGDHLGERDIISVHLSADPDDTVEVGLIYDPTQLEVRKLDGTLITNEAGHRLSFSDTTPEDLVVTALVDGLREGFHTSLISFELHSALVDDDVEVTEEFQTFTDFPVFFLGLENAPELDESITVDDDGLVLTRVFAPDVNGVFVGGDYFVVDNKIVFVDPTGDPLQREGLINVTYTFVERDFDGAFTQPVLARINDFEAPTVIVRETGGTTDVIEVNTTDNTNPNFIPVPVSGSPWEDSYQLVLSAQPDDDVVVTVTPDITKTTRTGGIRHDDVQVELSSSDGRAELQTFTANAGEGSATTLLDEDATFISDGVRIGMLIRNLSGGWVHVVDVVSENELETEAAAASWDGANYTFGNWKVTFSDANWDNPVEFAVRAIDDDQVDGQDTQVFKPGPATLSGILGPVVIEGAGGSGSLSLGVPVMLPGETNLRAPNGTVAGFTAGTGFGATEFMTVYLEDLQAFLDADDAEGDDLQTLDDLVGLTIEMARGQGVGVQLNPDRPQEAYDRFWLIEEINPGPTGDLRVLTLKNPSQVDPSTLALSDRPIADPSGISLADFEDGEDPAQAYAITALSANFFVEETVQVDVVFVNDQDSPADSSGVLTSTRLYGFNMGPDLVIGGQLRSGGITYDDFEVIEINLGKGNNDLEVLGTHTRDDGYRTWTLVNTGDETVEFADVDDPFALEKGDDVVLHLNAEDQVFTGTVGVAQNADVGAGILTTTITVDQSFANGSLQGALISIGQLGGVDTDATGQERRILNNVGSVLTVDRPWAALPTDESYTITNEADGPIAVNLQLGDDFLDGADSDLGIVAFGGLGADTLIGGDGDDILFGDRGRVDYFNEIDAIVTRLGDAPEPITGFVTAQVVEGTPGTGETDLFTIEDTGTKLSGDVPIGGSFPVADTDGNEEVGTEDIGLRGLYVDINNGFGFLQPVKLIAGNDATHLFLSHLETDAGFDPDEDLPGPVAENPAEYRISTIPEDQTDGVVRDPTLLITVDNDLGDSDTITAGGGKDTIFGGAGGDDIDAGGGDDIVLGDAGRLDRERDPDLPDELVVFLPRSPVAPEVRSYIDRLRTIEFSEGGIDEISGGAGADTILGGFAGDAIFGGGDDDIVIGDNGEVDYIVAPGIYGVISQVLTSDTVPATGADDTIGGDAGDDILIGGVEDDTIDGGAGTDIVLGDDGVVEFEDGNIASVTDPGMDGDDILAGGDDPDLLIGGFGDDTISGEGDDDILIGDAAEVLYADDGVTIVSIVTVERADSRNGTDTMYGGNDDDIVIGGSKADNLDGGAQDDLVFGDNVLLLLAPGSGNAINPRFRALGGATIYDANGEAQAGIDPQARPGGGPAWADWTITLDQTFVAAHFGDDYIAGGAGDDQIFGQLGNETIQGDGSIDGKVDGGNPAAAARDGSLTGKQGLIEVGTLQVVPSFEGAEDGDDYIEGNAGSDVIFGNLGQDDILGGSSTLFSLRDLGDPANDKALRADGSDLIFGGAGTDILRNNLGDASFVANGDTQAVVVDVNGHGHDADVILGDNGNIFRLVSVAGGTSTYRGFEYDNDYGEQLVVRAPMLLDYTPGGVLGAASAGDIGAADELHGESGDDFIYGQKGDDVLYGEGQDDDLIGGTGKDWISGGSGDDGVIGDDGRIFTSRNSSTLGEPLYGVGVLQLGDPSTKDINGNVLDEAIATPGSMQQATINVGGELKKAVNLAPFSVDPNWTAGTATADEFGGVPVPHNSDDIIYGGWGDDWLHGGSGDDAMSGAEALPGFYGNPVNPGNVLGYGALKGGEFAAYKEDVPLEKIEGFLLNFDAGEGPAAGSVNGTDFHSDGNDRIFGDLGNDWIVGGTGRDDLYGGWGDDLMNADDDHDSTAGTAEPLANNVPDTHPSYEDRAYGGAGRDVLIGNTGGDRLVDWAGEFNSYVVPFAPFGLGTVSRMLQPQLAEFLYALSASDGADPTRDLDQQLPADDPRNGEPYGELGVVRQQDFAWQEQTGAPADPQAGNIPGGKRDVLRSATFDSAAATGFFADSGKWSAQNGTLQVTAESIGGDAVSVFDVGDALPAYFEVQASVMAIKPTAGWNANSYIIFGYRAVDDFKFAGIDVSLNKLLMGHRDASGWHVDEQAPVPGGVKADKYYNLLLAVNGVNAILVMDNKNVFTHTYQPRIVDGYSYGLNWGMVGVGSNNSRGSFDNIAVQILPPQLTFNQVEDFVGQPTLSFSGYMNGAWSVGNGVYAATPNGTTGMSLLDLGPDNLDFSSYLELNAKVSAAGRAGFVFDRYADGSFKFAMIDAPADQVVIGHYTPQRGWVNDAVVSKVISGEHTLGVALKGTTVSVTLNGQTVLGHAFYASTVDGGFGLIATSGAASFDDVRVKTNDPAFAEGGGGASLLSAAPAGAASGSVLTQSELDGIASVAISQWIDALGSGDARLAALGDVRFAIADLEGSELGHAAGNTIVVDTDAAANGWFVDVSPASSSDFRVRLDRNVFAAATDSEAFGRMDLFSVVGHEIGHLLGFDHDAAADYAVMSESLDLGVRDLFGAATSEPGAQPIANPRELFARGMPGFDAAAGFGGVNAAVNWQDAASSDGWSIKLSPYAADKPAKSASPNIVGFLVKLLGKGQVDAQNPGFDSLGRELLGKDRKR